jgi:hypothetical protein
MRQIKEWAMVNGGAPSVVLVGIALLAIAIPLGLVVIGIGIVWFVAWLEPVRRLLIRFLEFPGRRGTTPPVPSPMYAPSSVQERALPLDSLPPGSEVTIKLPKEDEEEEIDEES